MSWCARVRRGGTIRVLHGSGVETRADRFVEGAWDGEFEAFDFDQAHTLAGSGGILRDGACVFATPFHPLERLYVVQGDDSTVVSNSLVFALDQTHDGPDLAYPSYFFDLIRMVRRGVGRQPVARLRTAQGRHMELYAACRLRLDDSLRLTTAPMPLGPPPANYGEYFELLYRSAKGVVANAADPARKSTFRPVAACSRGYDSTASAALASRVGCVEGITFAKSGRPTGHPITGLTKPPGDDSGADSLRALGMNVTERLREDVIALPGHPKAELFFRPWSSTDASMLVMEDKLAGGVFFSGRHGERYWGPTSRCSRKNFAEADDVNLSGHAYGEFRARAGFVHFPAPYIGALHGPAIYRITHSEEMRPWKLGSGYYDRPIARRIAEEAGVPRENFGHQKFGTSEKAGGLGEASERDFQDFLSSRVPEEVLRRLDPRRPRERLKQHYRVAYLRTSYSHWPFSSELLELLQTDRLHRLWNSIYLYIFHWGIEKTRARYRLD